MMPVCTKACTRNEFKLITISAKGTSYAGTTSNFYENCLIIMYYVACIKLCIRDYNYFITNDSLFLSFYIVLESWSVDNIYRIYFFFELENKLILFKINSFCMINFVISLIWSETTTTYYYSILHYFCLS